MKFIFQPANLIFIVFSGRKSWTNWGVLGAKSLMAQERKILC
jgi:hypothetical protein